MRYANIEVVYQLDESGPIGRGQYSFLNVDITDSTFVTVAIQIVADVAKAAIADYEKKVAEKQKYEEFEANQANVKVV